MAEQDELQIRVGLSVAGAEKVQTTARAAETKTQQVEQKVRRVEGEIASAERRSNAIEKKVLKMGIGFAVGSLLETGLDAVIPTDDQNAISVFSRVGRNIAVPALMSPNPVGVILALINGAITIVQEDIKKLDDQIKIDRDAATEFKDRFEKQQADFRARLEVADARDDKKIEELVRRGYLELRSGL